jgi:hypothetical protein
MTKAVRFVPYYVLLPLRKYPPRKMQVSSLSSVKSYMYKHIVRCSKEIAAG